MPNQPAVRIADNLEVVAQAIDDYVNSVAGTHGADSIHADELATKYRRPNGEPDIGGIGVAVASAYFTLASAADHIHSACRLMIDGQGEASVQRYAVFSVLRVALETSSLTFWLVNPAIGPKERMTRGLRYAEYSRRLRETALRAVSDEASTKPFTEQGEAIRRTAEYHRIDKITQRFQAGKDFRIPNAVDLVCDLFGSARGAGPDDGDIGVAVYRLASEPMHGNVYGALGGYRHPGPADAVQGMMYPSVDLGLVAWVADHTVIAVDRAIQAFCYLMGWDPTAWSEATQAAQQDLGLLAHNLPRSGA